jgi:hypothetical protein
MRCGFCAIIMHTAARVWCDRKAAVTSPPIGRYNNDATSGDVANELTLDKKSKR